MVKVQRLFAKTNLKIPVFETGKSEAEKALCSLSALGLIFSAIAIPLTFGVRYLLNRYGPKED